MALPAFFSSNFFILFASLAVLTLAAPWLSKLLEHGVVVLLALAIVFIILFELQPATLYLRGLRHFPGWVFGGG